MLGSTSVKKCRWRPVWALVALMASAAQAEEALPDIEQAKRNEDCLRELMVNASPTMTLGELQEECRIIDRQVVDKTYSKAASREIMERRSQWNPFVVTAHRKNYLLPLTYAKDPNKDVYNETLGIDNLDRTEAKLQISLKVPLTSADIFVVGDSLHFAFTLKAFWQVYNKDYSSPFRETNYRPELFYEFPIEQNWLEADTSIALGIEHESNGRSQLLSRSWNRLYLNFAFAKEDYLIEFRPWYRIPEDPKDSPEDPKGDDNPDIYRYMGYFELHGIWKRDQIDYSLMLRNNLNSPNYGAIQVEVGFPLWGRIRGMAQFFSGYGESLIDYDHHVDRIGIGIMLTDTL